MLHPPPDPADPANSRSANGPWSGYGLGRCRTAGGGPSALAPCASAISGAAPKAAPIVALPGAALQTNITEDFFMGCFVNVPRLTRAFVWERAEQVARNPDPATKKWGGLKII